MPWTVELETQALTWLRQLAVTHPCVGDRVVAAIDAFGELGPQVWRAQSARDAKTRGQPLVILYFQEARSAKVVRIVSATSRGSLRFRRRLRRADVIFEPLPPDLGRPAPARLASRMMTLLIQVLPPAERTRYAEEFHAELFDLARYGTGRGRQIAYALRVASQSWRLRAELKAAHRSRAFR